jgi:hypothetical protein
MATADDKAFLAETNKRLGTKYTSVKAYLTDNGKLEPKGDKAAGRLQAVQNFRGKATRTKMVLSGSVFEEAKKLVPNAKGFMGAGGEPILTAASFLNNRFGMSIDTKGVTDATVLRTRLFAGILENLKKLDSQPTALQQAALQEALGSLGTDPTALPRVLDTYGESLRTKVDLHNQEVTDAEKRGVKFPFKPQIALPSKVSFPAVTTGAIAYLKANPNTKDDFESTFGPGTANKILGR